MKAGKAEGKNIGL